MTSHTPSAACSDRCTSRSSAGRRVTSRTLRSCRNMRSCLFGHSQTVTTEKNMIVIWSRNRSFQTATFYLTCLHVKVTMEASCKCLWPSDFSGKQVFVLDFTYTKNKHTVTFGKCTSCLTTYMSLSRVVTLMFVNSSAFTDKLKLDCSVHKTS